MIFEIGTGKFCFVKTYFGLPNLVCAPLIGGCGKEKITAPAGASLGYFCTLEKNEHSSVKSVDTASPNQDIQLSNVQEGYQAALGKGNLVSQ